jgi:osmotically-inducible protein OsmY
MANRYRNQNYPRYGQRRGGSGYGRGRFGSQSERGSYGSETGGSFDYDREENYFGSGRQQFGQGYTGSATGRGYGSYRRDFEEDHTGGGQGYSGRRGRGGDFDRESYGGEYYGQGSGYGDYDERSDYDRGLRGNFYGQSEYPYSERGYETERGDYDDDRGWLDKASDEVSSWFGDEEAARRRRMDQREISHRGRGPRNYKRSDSRIEEDINDYLTDNDYLDASDIFVEVSNGEVILSGTVDSRYAKRLAEDIAEDVSGVTNVENRIRVRQNYADTTGYTGTTGTTESTATTGTNTGTTAGTTTTGTTTETTGTTAAKSRGRGA